MARCSALVLFTVASFPAACSEPEGVAVREDCEYEEREVSLDAVFGEETPRQVIGLLERPVEGPMTWYAGEGEFIDVTGVAAGTALYHAEATASRTVWVREGEEGKGGVQESRITCPTELWFDLTVRFETTDGGLAEDWRGRARYRISGTLGGGEGIHVEIEEPRAFGGTLTVTEHPDIHREWDTHGLGVTLVFITYPLDFVGLHGDIRHHVQNSGSGSAEGAVTTIAEFALP